MNIDQIEPLFYSPVATMRLLGIGRTKFYAEVNAGRLRLVHNGSRSFVPREDIRAYADSILQGELNARRVARPWDAR